MDHREYLIDWIHKAELRFRKGNSEGVLSERLPSLITDLHFELHIAGRADLDLCMPLSFGWAVEDHGDCRRWYKISEAAQGTLRNLNFSFVNKIRLADNSARFFIVIPSFWYTDNGPPDMTYEIKEFVCDKIGWQQADNQSTAEALSNNVSTKVRTSLRERAISSHDSKIAPWLRSLNVDQLQRLFTVRCFMNFSNLFLTDIDAIGINEAGNIQIIEFKRKGPAGGNNCFQFLPALISKDPLPTYLKIINSELKRFQTSEKLLCYLEISEHWQRMPKEGCFGLDASHTKNVDLCAKAGMSYRHVIWDTTKKPADLLSHDLKPKEVQSILVLNILPTHLQKLTFTEGRDSGSYNQRLRFQLMISAQQFSHFSIERDANI